MSTCPFASRRGFLAGVGGLAGAGMLRPARADTAAPPSVEPFYGARQGGSLTPSQSHTYLAVFDLNATQATQVAALLKLWTAAAARMAAGQPAGPPSADPNAPDGDSGDALGLPPSRLTLTFGFGPGLFVKDGKDRYGLASRRPEALADLPRFNGDQLLEARTGGDISVQACADDPQVAFHAVRQLSRLSYGMAALRWAQAGFSSSPPDESTGRNLMGFKDGTANPVARPTAGVKPDEVVWIGGEGPDWLRGGSYVVVRRIRISLEHWDRTDTEFQEQVIGRRKRSGAPLGSAAEFDPPDFAATDKDGNPLIPDDAHVRLANPANVGGASILRRGYSYNDGLSFTAERWPPWRQGMMYDAGLLFVAYQRDPRTGFIRIFEPMAKLDALNQFSTHVGSGLFAVPPGVAQGESIGQTLFDAA